MTSHMHAVLASLLLNVVSSVGVIFVNKSLVFDTAHFRFGTTLTVIHFLVTFVGCLFFARARFFEIKKLPILNVLTISIAFCGYVVFNNLSLLTNSVSVYQTSKILCTPVIVLVEYLFYGNRESVETLLALAPVCVGVFITVFTDSELNAVGAMWAFLAMIANSFYTIWGKTKQVELNVTPMQILTYQAPLSAFLLLFALPLDNVTELQNFEWDRFAFFAIGLSCVFAFGVNFSFFLFVGQTSPLTMNVVGYFKTCLVFIGGFFVSKSHATPQNIAGVVVTLAGLALYTRATVNRNAAQQQHSNATSDDAQGKPRSCPTSRLLLIGAFLFVSAFGIYRVGIQSPANQNLYAMLETTAPLPQRQVSPKTILDQPLSLPTNGRYAYVFYATTRAHIYHSLVVLEFLKRVQTRLDRIDVLVVHTLPVLDPADVQRLNDNHVKTRHVSVLQGAAGGHQESLTKLHIFNQTQYDRIVYLDSDMIVERNLDHLFSLPKAALAWTLSHWMDVNWGTSCFMVIEPSEELFARLMETYAKASAQKMTAFDMDVINLAFRKHRHERWNDVLQLGPLILPPQYLVLTFVWRDRLMDVPPLMGLRTLEEVREAVYIVHFSGAKKPYQFVTFDDFVTYAGPQADPTWVSFYRDWIGVYLRLIPEGNRAEFHRLLE